MLKVAHTSSIMCRTLTLSKLTKSQAFVSFPSKYFQYRSVSFFTSPKSFEKDHIESSTPIAVKKKKPQRWSLDMIQKRKSLRELKLSPSEESRLFYKSDQRGLLVSASVFASTFWGIWGYLGYEYLMLPFMDRQWYHQLMILSGLAIGTMTCVSGGFLARQSVHSMELLEGKQLKVIRHLPFGMLAKPVIAPISDFSYIQMADDRFLALRCKSLNHNMLIRDQLDGKKKSSNNSGFIGTDRNAFKELLQSDAEKTWQQQINLSDDMRALSPTLVDAHGKKITFDCPYEQQRELERQFKVAQMDPTKGWVDPSAP